MKNNNETKKEIIKIIKIIIGVILMAICTVALIGLIGYIALESEKDTSKLMSSIAGIVAVNEIITLKENFFPSENKELKELKMLNEKMQKIIDEQINNKNIIKIKRKKKRNKTKILYIKDEMK